MLCATHRLIANKFYEALNNEYRNLIDLESLLRGSVAPDSAPSMVIIPHTKNSSFKFLLTRIESLVFAGLRNENLDSKDFSFKLGVIIHFISDYFCNAHNDFKFINPLIHFLYENKLKKFFLNEIGKYGISTGYKKLRTLTGIKKYILEKHNEYMLRSKNMENDFSYSLETVLTVSVNIFSQAAKKSSHSSLLADAQLKTRTA